MKYLLVLSAIFLLANTALQAQTQKTAFSFKAKKIKIQGVLKNYLPNEHNQYIQLKTYAIEETGRGNTVTTEINKAGKFSFETDIPYWGNALIVFEGKATLPFYILSTETILEIDYLVFSTTKSLVQATIFKDKHAKFNTQYIAFWQQLLNTKFTNNPDMSNRKQSNAEFCTVTKLRLQEEIALLDNFCNQHKETNTNFYNYISQQITYEKGLNASHFMFSKKNDSISYEEMLQLLSFIPLQCNNKYYNSYYFIYLNSLAKNFHYTTNTQKQYNDSIKLYGDKINFTFYKLQQLIQPPILELMAYNLAISFLDELKRNNKKFTDTSLFNQLVKNDYFKQQFYKKNTLAKPFTKFNVLDSLLANTETIAIANKLKEMMEQANASFLYIDFWGTWCKPCMQELPYYNQLIQSFENKQIEFLFLAVDTEEAAINKTKTEFGINKTFLRLNENERNLMNKYFKFSSYPSHFLLNKKGEIIEQEFPPIKYQNTFNPMLTNYLIKLMDADK